MNYNIFQKFFIVLFILGVLLFPNFSHALTTLLEDNFTGTTINQGKWTMVGGTEGVDYIQNGNINVRNSGGTFVPGSTTSLQSATSFAKGDDLTISANVTSTGGYSYLGYGDYSSGTYYYVLIHSTLGYDGYIRKAGSAYSNNTSCGTYTAGAKVSMKITSNSFEVYKDDVYQCAVVVDGTAPTMTTHPIFLKGATTVSFFDNVLVTNTTSAPPATVPDAITNLAASEWGNTTTNLTWTAPSNGGDAITDYTVEYRVSGAVSWNTFNDGVSASSGATVTGLTNGTTYEFRVFAVNGVGTSSASNTASVTVLAPTVPNAPTGVSAASVFGISGGSVSVSFTAPSSNGSSITGYTVTSSPGNITATGSSSPIVVSGLTNNQAYTFTVTATNGVGTSSASSISNSATPEGFPDGRASWTERSGASSRAWADVANSSDGSKAVAVVNSGYIYTTTDYGANWTERTGAGSRIWTAVASSSDGSKLLASVFNGYLYASTNSGANWTQLTSAGQRNWVDVTSSSDGVNLFAITSTGAAYFSTNSGSSWTISSIYSKSWEATTSSSDGSLVYAVDGDGSSSYVVYSTNYGAVFDSDTDSGSRSWNSITTSDNGNIIYAGANNGYIYKTSNGGVSWSALTGVGSRIWNSLATSSDGSVILGSTTSGKIYLSIDGGITWYTETSSTTWNGVSISDDGSRIYAVRENGYIYTAILDLIAPTITNISSDKANGTYATGEVIDIDVTFSEAVTSTGNVTITLETGTTDRTCTFTVSNSDTGTCNYTVVVGDNTLDLNVSSVSGTIADEATNTLTNFSPATNLATNKSLVIDAIPPVISAVGSSTTNTTSTISWTTDKVASSYVEYGLTSSYGTTTAEIDTGTRVLNHEVILSSLVKCTTYYYRVRSKDSALNPGVGEAGTFATLGCVGGASIEDVVAESISNTTGGTASLSYDSATISLNIPPAVADQDSVFQIKVLTKDDVVNVSGTPDGNLIQAETDMYDLKAYTDIDTKISTFNEPIEITMSYEDSEISGINESSLTIYRYDEEAWYPASDCEVDTSANEITCSTTNFSVFSIFGTAPVVVNNQNAGGVVSVAFLQEISDRLRAQNSGCEANNLYSTKTGLPCNQNVKIPNSTCPVLSDFPKVLKLNNKNNSVKVLQEILNCKGYIVSNQGAGSKGKETILFGKKTKDALIKFQIANNLKGDGISGPNTRAILNK